MRDGRLRPDRGGRGRKPDAVIFGKRRRQSRHFSGTRPDSGGARHAPFRYTRVCAGHSSAALTVRGNLDEALTLAREAAPLLRDEGTLSWHFDHLALRAALDGRMRDAAIIAGYANA